MNNFLRMLFSKHRTCLLFFFFSLVKEIVAWLLNNKPSNDCHVIHISLPRALLKKPGYSFDKNTIFTYLIDNFDSSKTNALTMQE